MDGLAGISTVHYWSSGLQPFPTMRHLAAAGMRYAHYRQGLKLSLTFEKIASSFRQKESPRIGIGGWPRRDACG